VVTVAVSAGVGKTLIAEGLPVLEDLYPSPPDWIQWSSQTGTMIVDFRRPVQQIVQ
jgi:hypothetical protein